MSVIILVVAVIAVVVLGVFGIIGVMYLKGSGPEVGPKTRTKVPVNGPGDEPG